MEEREGGNVYLYVVERKLAMTVGHHVWVELQEELQLISDPEQTRSERTKESERNWSVFERDFVARCKRRLCQRILSDGNMSPCIPDLFVFVLVSVDVICYLCSLAASLNIVHCQAGHPYILLDHQKMAKSIKG